MRLPVALALLLLVVGCAAAPTVLPDPREQAQVRTDPSPVTRRFPDLGTPVAVSWIGGTLGDDRVPGPSRFFVDAVVSLADGDAARLLAAHGTGPGGPPDVPGPLRAAAGDATWTELPGVPGPAGWSTQVWLDPATRLAYVRAVGE